MASSKATNINYVENYFIVKILSKIHGEPNFETLKTLRNQVKANAGSVTTHLGGGALFGNGRGGAPASKALVEFRAGKMTVSGSLVSPDKRKGMIQVKKYKKNTFIILLL